MVWPFEVSLDFSKNSMEGTKRRRRKKRWSVGYREKVRRYLQQVGFSAHERNLWVKERITLAGRAGQNLIYARGKKMDDYLNKGYRFDEAVKKSEKDRIEDSMSEGQFSRSMAEKYLFGELWELDPDERKVTGPVIRVR